MDDALVGGAAVEAPPQRLHARDVLLDAADGDGQQPRSLGAHLQDDQRGDPTPLFVRLSALGYGSAVDDLRSAVPLGAGQAQYPRRQRQAALQSRADPVRDQDQTPRGARRGTITAGGAPPWEWAAGDWELS